MITPPLSVASVSPVPPPIGQHTKFNSHPHTAYYTMNVRVLLFSLCFPLLSVNAQDTFVVVNIGIKLGYAVSAPSSMVGGLEVSVNYYRDRKGIGVLVSTEQWYGRSMDHYAVQAFYGLMGMSFGPSIMRTKTSRTSGYSGTLFGGAIVLPYYRFSVFHDDTNAHEVGFYAKLPLPVVHPNLDVGG
jgi:hypothetical protein